MSNFLQQNIKLALVLATLVYGFSILLWFGWVTILLLGAGYAPFLLAAAAGITTLLYPVVVVRSLLAGWRFQRGGQDEQAAKEITKPLLYLLVMLVVGTIAFMQGSGGP